MGNAFIGNDRVHSWSPAGSGFHPCRQRLPSLRRIAAALHERCQGTAWLGHANLMFATREARLYCGFSPRPTRANAARRPPDGVAGIVAAGTGGTGGMGFARFGAWTSNATASAGVACGVAG